jgi:hypothetical protein
MKRLSNELNQFLVISLIFLIIFRDNIDLLKNKNTYYLLCLIFIISLFVLKNEPGIILLYSILFILIWYEHNIKN